MDLIALRTKIDAVDRELVALFCRRMELSEQVAVYKQEHGLPVLDKGREAELLQRVAALSSCPQETAELYHTILYLSRRRQERSPERQENR